MEQKYIWRATYLGALAAFGINRTEGATELAELTRSDEDVAGAIATMRTSGEGSRVWCAREWLRMKRGTSTFDTQPETLR